MNKLKIGFIGGGHNSAVGRTHAVASQMDGRWGLVAGCFSRHEAVNRETAQVLHVSDERTYPTWQEFLDRERGNLDAVAILTPTPLHFDQVSKALELGYNVICEKAMTTNLAEALAISDRVTETGRFFGVTFNYSGYPMIRELRERIARGQLGRVFLINIEMPQEGFLRRDPMGNPVKPQEWRQRDGFIPSVSLDLGTHVHHLIEFLLGSGPESVVSRQSTHGRIDGVVDYVGCLARCADDVDVIMNFGKCTLGHRNGLKIRVYGDEGSAEWIQTEPEVVKLSDSRGEIRLVDRSSPDASVSRLARYERFKVGHPAGFVEAFGNLYWDLADVVVDHCSTGTSSNSFVFGAHAAARGLAMLEAIARSSQSESWCRVDVVPS